MPRRFPKSTRHSWFHRFRWRLSVATAISSGVVLAVAGTAAAATPTDPPPVTILTSSGHAARGDIFITPTGDTGTYANGPEILDRRGNVVWFHATPQGLTAADFRTQEYLGRPVLTFWQGTGLGGLASGTDYVYNDHYQQIATVQRRQRSQRRRTRVPDHTMEHGADPGLHHRYREPDIDRRPREPNRDKRCRPGDRHRNRPGVVPVEQRGPRALQSE